MVYNTWIGLRQGIIMWCYKKREILERIMSCNIAIVYWFYREYIYFRVE